MQYFPPFGNLQTSKLLSRGLNAFSVSPNSSRAGSTASIPPIDDNGASHVCYHQPALPQAPRYQIGR
ncbi:hypothetical protein PDIG_58740 [Penicillium digitatum PHI26]|uniref:Uncharacterized protein n=1 Tax=Penicillium digitatum (strain PHI26 / CECT 20796) TaxID=1170229 RepID=K9G5R2_PEND2|nr:hypothetical protein PDIG_58740 [Penicillium digitatum PHI26]